MTYIEREKQVRLLNLISEIWSKNPDLRLCQVLQNPFPPCDMYYIEDNDLENKLREYYEIEKKKENKTVPD